MPTELEELVEFLHHGNTQIRQIACEHLVGYSASNAAIFKKNQLEPITDLKLLVRDYTPIAKNALTILINLSSSQDEEVLKTLAEDDAFLITLLKKVTNPKDTNAGLASQLLANLSKSPSLERLLKIELPVAPVSTSTAAAAAGGGPPAAPHPPQPPQSPIALNQLLDLFVSGRKPSSALPAAKRSDTNADTETDPDAHFDYLSYVLANLSAAHASIRSFLLTQQAYDGIVPLSKIVVFTTHASLIRRRGVASTLKNVCFEAATKWQQEAAEAAAEAEAQAKAKTEEAEPTTISSSSLVSSSTSSSQLDLLLDENQVRILPYLLLPLMGNEEYSAEETEEMLLELQLLPEDKQREADQGVLVTLVETLLLLTTPREGRDVLRRSGVYPIIRMLHEKVASEQVREVCERLVDMLMRDEADDAPPDDAAAAVGAAAVPSVQDKEEGVVKDREIEEVF